MLRGIVACSALVVWLAVGQSRSMSPSVAADDPLSSPSTLKSLQNELIAEHQREYNSLQLESEQGQIPSRELHEAKEALLEAKLDAAEKKQDRIKLRSDLVKHADLEYQRLQQLADAVPARQLYAAKRSLIRAKIALEKEKQ